MLQLELVLDLSDPGFYGASIETYETYFEDENVYMFEAKQLWDQPERLQMYRRDLQRSLLEAKVLHDEDQAHEIAQTLREIRVRLDQITH